VASLASGRAIVDRLRSVGVPHVVWVLEGSEPAGHLPELVERAEDHGLVCGLRARASDLPAQALEGAIAAGLDHVDLLFGGADTRHAEIFGQDDLGHLRAHLEAVRGEMLGCRAVVPLPTEERHLSIADLVDGVVARGFGTAAFFFLVAATPEPEAVGALLRQWSVDLERALEVTRLPGEICVPEQVAAEGWRAQARRGPRTIGEATVGVTGEGLVLPPEGPATPAGNLIGERWDRIWAAPVFSAWREAGAEPERCGVCPGLEACRRGCLADPGRFVRADDRAAAEEVEA
jgi:MoaA/NifB/PqqE/SkfB family radical SAM enzyme